MQQLLPIIALCAFALPGQTTTRVTGPGLPAAIRAAAAGDILLVSGTYSSILTLTIDKPLFIHGLPGAKLLVVQGVEIKSIPGGASFVLQGFEISSLRVLDCAGRVLVAGITASNITTATVAARNCADLALEECTLGPLTLDSCTSTLARSLCKGIDFSSRTFPDVTAGVIQIGGSLRVADTTLLGGVNRDQNSSLPKGLPGLQISRLGFAEMTGATIVRAGLGLSNAVPAVGGVGVLTYDRSVVLTPYNGPAIGPTITAWMRSIPVTTIRRTPLGGMARAELRGQPGATFALFFGWPGNPVVLPGIGGTLTVSQPFLLQLGTLGTAGVSTFDFRVPDDPRLRGSIYRWQGGTIVSGVAQWGHPATECHF